MRHKMLGLDHASPSSFVGSANSSVTHKHWECAAIMEGMEGWWER